MLRVYDAIYVYTCASESLSFFFIGWWERPAELERGFRWFCCSSSLAMAALPDVWEASVGGRTGWEGPVQCSSYIIIIVLLFLLMCIKFSFKLGIVTGSHFPASLIHRLL